LEIKGAEYYNYRIARICSISEMQNMIIFNFL